MNLILIAVISLGAIGLIAAVILYVASKKFAVYEDPRIAQVAEVLPQANCGGCGFPGCAGFASACVKAADAGSLEGKLCPAGGTPTMEKIAAILGMEAVASEPKIAAIFSIVGVPPAGHNFPSNEPASAAFTQADAKPAHPGKPHPPQFA